MSGSPERPAFFGIFPPINVARMGDSEEYAIGPEIPGVEPVPSVLGASQRKEFRDEKGKIIKVGARFRVYGFDEQGQVLSEICDDDNYSLTWTVRVANKKSAWVHFRGRYAEEDFKLRNNTVQGWTSGQRDTKHTDMRDKLIVDSGDQVIAGVSKPPIPLHGRFFGSRSHPTLVHLGDIRTDDKGRLIVTASDGDSFCVSGNDPHPPLLDKFNNDDWVDSVCDGTVHVEIKSRTSPELHIDSPKKATIITAPPKFANGAHCPTSLLDIIDEIYEEQRRQMYPPEEKYVVGEVDFTHHIRPMFNRMYVNSWTNSKANEGHGPRKVDIFNDPRLEIAGQDDQDALSLRRGIFNRMRWPVREDEQKNREKRLEQAKEYYMPRISGDTGDLPERVSDRRDKNTPNYEMLERNRWGSLTKLQYDRLERWSQGDFIPPVHISSDQSELANQPEGLGNFDRLMSLSKQPHALAISALEWCVGAPMYPGIEVYWAAALPETYDLTGVERVAKDDDFQKQYRIADHIKPGDLTKGLALPWQSDFWMCNTHWWPSIRPDDVVTEQHFDEVVHTPDIRPEEIARSLTNRVPWDRGLIRDPDDERVGGSSMVRQWTQLGFITKKEYGNKEDGLLDVYVERGRNLK